ncbi:MAG: DUF2306 domain-containing protein [Bacteroidota bacterium]
MKRTILFALLLIVAITLTALSWHYFGSDEAGILARKPQAVKSWLPTFLRIHIGGGMIAMLCGAGLVFTSRGAKLSVHRYLGRIYASAVLVSGMAGLIVAPHAIGGAVSGFGLGSLALAWMYFTVRTIQHALNKEWVAHQRAAAYSLALTFSSLTFRLFLLFAFLGYPFTTVYRTSCWVSWLLHLGIVAVWFSYRGQTTNQLSKTF